MKYYVTIEIETATFRLLAQCLNQLRRSVLPLPIYVLLLHESLR